MRFTLALTTLLALAPAFAEARSTPARPSAAETAARARLDSARTVPAKLERYVAEGRVWQKVRRGEIDQLVEVPSVWAADLAAQRSRNQADNPFFSTLSVLDGDTLWTAATMLGQHSARPLRSLKRDASHDRIMNPLLELAPVTEGARLIRPAGRDTVRLEDGVATCDRIEAIYHADTSQGVVTRIERMHWVDRATGLVVRDSALIVREQLAQGSLVSTLERRVTRLRTGDQVADTLFVFQAPEGSGRVRRLGMQGEGPAILGRPAPEFSLAGLDGTSTTLASLRGKVVVLDFWATWCGPCRRWMPIVEKVEKAAQPHGVQVFAVNLRESDAKVQAYLRQTGVRVPVLMDRDGRIGTAYGAASIPLTVIVGRDGIVVDALLGVHSEDDLLESLRLAGVEID